MASILRVNNGRPTRFEILQQENRSLMSQLLLMKSKYNGAEAQIRTCKQREAILEAKIVRLEKDVKQKEKILKLTEQKAKNIDFRLIWVTRVGIERTLKKLYKKRMIKQIAQAAANKENVAIEINCEVKKNQTNKKSSSKMQIDDIGQGKESNSSVYYKKPEPIRIGKPYIPVKQKKTKYVKLRSTSCRNNQDRHGKLKNIHKVCMCGRGFKSHADLKRHIHIEIRGVISCDECPMKFATPADIKKHKIREHPRGLNTKSSVCRDCNHFFHNQWELKKHWKETECKQFRIMTEMAYQSSSAGRYKEYGWE